MEGDLLRLDSALSLAEEEGSGVIIPQAEWEKGASGFQLTLVGRVLSSRAIHFDALKDSLLSILQPAKGVVPLRVQFDQPIFGVAPRVRQAREWHAGVLTFLATSGGLSTAQRQQLELLRSIRPCRSGCQLSRIGWFRHEGRRRAHHSLARSQSVASVGSSFGPLETCPNTVLGPSSGVKPTPASVILQAQFLHSFPGCVANEIREGARSCRLHPLTQQPSIQAVVRVCRLFVALVGGFQTGISADVEGEVAGEAGEAA
ncbi:hypothetical protein Salat_1738400 [Sesamum alatum]|uniref:Uncharacterized protein n=1 Tax=Sesamum alatum TaxID=300844 RepID=A0AAE1Y8P5_9LAMI|nr:hypothetical protein Salat_1738400 [Sesamum alatum]